MAIPSFDDIPHWESRLGLTRDVVRQHLVTQQVRAHLPPAQDDLLVVDIGCGQGTQVLNLARLGYHVTGIDPSLKLLSKARQDLKAEPPKVQDRVTLLEGDLQHLAEIILKPIDVLLCHGVLMYLPKLSDSLKTLADGLAPGGVLSLLTRNQRGIAMRAGMSRNWDEAITGFDARHYTNRLRLKDVRADTPEEVTGECEKLGLTIQAWYGVRLFTDHWADDEKPGDMASLLKAEEQASERDPYRQLAALTHVIARRP